MAALMVLGMAVTLAIAEPFQGFTSREHWIVILVFVAIYKYGDALFSTMANPFTLTWVSVAPKLR